MKKAYLYLAIIFLGGALSCIVVEAQNPTPAPPPKPTPMQRELAGRPATQDLPPLGQRRDEQQPDPEEVKRQKEREKAMNKDRYVSLKKDTDQLLALATELKQSVDATTENKLSLEVIRKTEEIEKLAKKVRDKMKAN